MLDVPSEAHLQMIQSVVSRLASQSTTVKGWCVTVTGALLGFGATRSTPLVAFVAVYVVVAFAVLDAYYLALERGYRSLYASAARGDTGSWSLEVPRATSGQIVAALRSPSVALLYGASLLVALTVGVSLILD